MTREMGKVLAETRGDVQEAIDEALLRGRRGPAALRRHHPIGAARQIRHERAHACRRRRPHHAVELSHGDSQLEALSRAGRRQHLRDQAGHRHAALHLQPRAGAGRCGPSAGRGQYRLRHGFNGGRGAGRASRCARHQLHRIECGWFAGRATRRRHLQAGLARNGRQERADRARRRQSRSRARRRALGRVRHHGAALHGHQPHPSAKGNCRRVHRKICRAREKAEGRQRPR